MPSIVGSPIVVLLPTGASPGAQPAGGFTVPSGANLCLAFLGGSDDNGVTLTSLASNFTSSNFTVTNHPGFTGYGAQFGVAQINSSGSGKTITPVWSSGVVYGPTCTLVFMSVTDPATCIADLASEGATGRLFLDNSSGTTAVAGSVTSGATDLVFNYDCKYTTSSFIPGTPSGYTSLLTQADLGGATTRLSQANTPGSSTTSGTTVDTEYSSLIMAAVRDVGSSPQNVAPPLLTNGQTFYAPTVSLASGPQSVAPPLLTNTNTLYAPSVSIGTVQNVAPPLLTNSQTFYAPSVLEGALGQWLLDHPDAFMSQCVEAGDEAKFFSYTIVTPPATGSFTDGPYPNSTGVFEGPNAETMVIALSVNRVFVGNFTVFLYDQVGTQSVAPPLLSNSQTFYAPSVLRGAVNVLPPLFTNTNTLYAPTVVPQALTVSPPLLTNTQTFYGPTVVAGPLNVSPPLLTNTNTLYGPTVSGGTTTVIAPLLVNNQTFFGPTVVVGAVTVLPPLLVNTNTIFAPRVRHVVPPVPGEGRAPRLAIGIRIGL